MAVLHQINQQIEDLRLDRDLLGATPELAPVNVKQMIAKDKFQIRSSRAGRTGRFGKELSGASQP